MTEGAARSCMGLLRPSGALSRMCRHTRHEGGPESRRTKAEAACGFRNPLALEWLILVTAPRRLIATPLRMDHAQRSSDIRRGSSLRAPGLGSMLRKSPQEASLTQSSRGARASPAAPAPPCCEAWAWRQLHCGAECHIRGSRGSKS